MWKAPPSGRSVWQAPPRASRTGISASRPPDTAGNTGGTSHFSYPGAQPIWGVMFGDLLRRMTAPDPEPLPYDDARLALAALLVRVARSDGDYAAVEQASIDRALAHRYGMTQDASSTLRTEAEALEAAAPDTVRFTRAIKDAVPYEDRLHVIATLWFIA